MSSLAQSFFYTLEMNRSTIVRFMIVQRRGMKCDLQETSSTGRNGDALFSNSLMLVVCIMSIAQCSNSVLGI